MEAVQENPYRQVQGLRRGLSILQALNRAAGSDVTPRTVSEQTSLNRTTVKRILETLAADGYVRRNDDEGSYSLAPEVLLLSCGLASEERLTDARLLKSATPLLSDLVAKTGCSVSLATPDDDCMLLRKTTRSHEHDGQSELRKYQRLPILFSALGRAYFSDCQDDERERILTRLQSRGDDQVAIAKNTRLIEMLTRRVRDEGYAIQDGDWPGAGPLGAVATAIRSHKGKTIASLSIIYMRGRVTRSQIVDEFVPHLKHGAALLAADL